MNKSSGSENCGSTKAVQIIAPVNHSFELKLDVLKRILEDEKIKDHDVVVVSIAGAFRKGKSFLMNFFLKYLYAQYKTHDVTDWIGENKSETLNGFSWRGGQKPETIGLWMWPELFTHKFENNEKVAIILMDSQGLFDNESSLKDCIATFAITTLVSSVQCFNIMHQVQENDLQNLDLFAEYGRLVMDQIDEKPFQQLLFIIRDWPFPYDNEFGYNEDYINSLLTGNSKQTQEMLDLRERVRSNFDKINAFLMPYPGKNVSQEQDFRGNLEQIEPDFIKHVKELVPSLLAPENLVVKKINGHKLKPRDLMAFLEVYVEIFNGEEMPEPQTVLQGTAVASIFALYTKCLNMYTETMKKHIDQRSLNNSQPYFSEFDLKATHYIEKNRAISKFQRTRKLGGDEISKPFEEQLGDETEDLYKSFVKDNETKRNKFIELAKRELQLLQNECLQVYVSNMEWHFDTHPDYIQSQDLKKVSQRAEEKALTKFQNTSKRGTTALISEFKKKLETGIEEKFKSFQKINRGRGAAAAAGTGAAVIGVVGAIAIGLFRLFAR